MEAAMKKALTLTGCRGFCFKGKDATEPVEVFFKNKDDVRELCGISWTSYLVQGVESQDKSDKLQQKKFEENLKTAAANFQRVRSDYEKESETAEGTIGDADPLWRLGTQTAKSTEDSNVAAGTMSLAELQDWFTKARARRV